MISERVAKKVDRSGRRGRDWGFAALRSSVLCSTVLTCQI